ncbi:MAG: RNA pseudouridine synthase [Saprospiraceae bacterium]
MEQTTDKQQPTNASIGDWVIYKNNQLIAFNKPPGIPVQSDKTGDKSLLQLAEIYCKSTLYLIHRIDRPASGIVVFAKTKSAVGAMSQQFQEKTVNKTYLAVVKDKPAEESATLQHHLVKNQKTNKSEATAEATPDSKVAEMDYQLVGSSDNYHLLKLHIHTGRHHQIRAQLAAIGSPIKGDVKYGFRRSNKDRSIHLHAWKLTFNHPVSNEVVDLVAELPTDPVWDFFGEMLQ